MGDAMKKYRVTKPLYVHSGKIGLTQEQADPRKPFLRNVKGSVYEITDTIGFVSGEIIALETLPLAMAESLEPAPKKDDQ